jgi:CHAT domain-containing protein
MPVATVPSLGALVALRRRPAAAGGRRVVVGVADEEAPSIAEEASVIAAADSESRLLLGSDASVAAVRAASREANLLHIASHGRFVAESPLQSGLRLGDCWLTAREILSMRLPASLVILSGCDTGRVAVDGGDEVVGLLRSFFASGARGVVLSGWPVHDESAVRFMIEIHDGLGTSEGSSGTVPPQAAGRRTPASDVMRQATLAQRGRRGRMAEWAAFGLVGDVERS